VWKGMGEEWIVGAVDADGATLWGVWRLGWTNLRLFIISYTQSREFDFILVFHKAESSRAPSQLPVQHLYSQVVAQSRTKLYSR
jgi:hypothetical protein